MDSIPQKLETEEISLQLSLNNFKSFFKAKQEKIIFALRTAHGTRQFWKI
jgi:hypothetical protein